MLCRSQLFSQPRGRVLFVGSNIPEYLSTYDLRKHAKNELVKLRTFLIFKTIKLDLPYH